MEDNCTIEIQKAEYECLIRESEQLTTIKKLVSSYIQNADDIIREILREPENDNR